MLCMMWVGVQGVVHKGPIANRQNIQLHLQPVCRWGVGEAKWEGGHKASEPMLKLQSSISLQQTCVLVGLCSGRQGWWTRLVRLQCPHSGCTCLTAVIAFCPSCQCTAFPQYEV